MNAIKIINNKQETFTTTESNYSTADTKKSSSKPKLLKKFFLSKKDKYAKYITASNIADKSNQDINLIIKVIKDKYTLDKSLEHIAGDNIFQANRHRSSSCFALCNEKNNSSKDCKLI
jgi:hypothetical protein